MKLERLHEYVTVTVALILGFVVAIFCGKWAGNGQKTMLALVVGLIVVVPVVLALRTRVWMLIPMFWFAYGTPGGRFPMGLTYHDVVIWSVFVLWLAFIALKLVRGKPKYQTLDFWLFACLGDLAIIFLFHPTGVRMLGTERIGGKPYFAIVTAVLGYWVIMRANINARQAFWIPLFTTVGRALEAFFGFLSEYLPFTAPLDEAAYGVVSAETGDSPELWQPVIERKWYLQGFGVTGSMAACSYDRPLTTAFPFKRILDSMLQDRLLPAIFTVVRSWFLYLSFLCVLASGFRSNLLQIGAYFLLATYIRGGLRSMLRAGLIGICGLAILVAGNGHLFNLPSGIQRALSFLPGKWDWAVLNDAQGSADWRFEMWREALTTDHYIQDKLFGDGFGFTLRQWDEMRAAQEVAGYAGGPGADQENLLEVGQVHSGPISTIRVVGVLGLLLFLGFMTCMAVYAWRLIARARGTPYFPVAVFFGIPAVVQPFYFVLIYGGFDNDFPLCIFYTAMLRVTANSLDTFQPAEVKPKPKPHSFERAPEFIPVHNGRGELAPVHFRRS